MTEAILIDYRVHLVDDELRKLLVVHRDLIVTMVIGRRALIAARMTLAATTTERGAVRRETTPRFCVRHQFPSALSTLTIGHRAQFTKLRSRIATFFIGKETRTGSIHNSDKCSFHVST